ncbi:unnamed protein product [Adineta ricciae]|uniref:Uncharacterized protein n=1 Tax=Adineta ricciae TaxID=249248 RepID=A0A815U1W1_ADIRI|nr:unnamed protein product [Adineta ricciae]
MMKYQRVLYTNKFSSELKSKLRIVSYDKRRSLKGNVYYVRFASDADIAFADRICKRLQNVTMKPFQSRSTTVTSNPVIKSNAVIFKSNSLRSDNKASEESSIQVLDSTDMITSLTSNVPISNVNKQQLINDVQSCLNAVKIAQRVADDISQRVKDGMNCDTTLMNYLLQVHSTAFYLKAATSIQLKAILCTGIRLSWPDLASSINEFRLAVGHERSFMTKMTSASHILRQIDNEASITMSSKLAYQLTRLSH